MLMYKREPLEDDEIVSLRKACKSFDEEVCVNLLLETGMRVSELVDLNEDKVLVTNGSSEANYVACHTLLEDNDEVVMMVPNYMQIWGIVEELGAIPKAFHLKEEQQWAPDLEELKNLVNNKTRMIAICNPNNPTGYILTKDEMEKIVDIADEVGAWIYCDEIYRGAEVNNIETASFIGMYDKVLVTGGLSKAYALPGLRLGWLAGDKETIANAWAYHDYTSITSGLLSQKIAEFALEPKMRAKILNRNRNLLRAATKFEPTETACMKNFVVLKV